MSRRSALIVLIGIISVAALAESGRISSNKRQPPSADSDDIVRRNESAAKNPAEIDAGVFVPYNRENWSKTFAMWGEVGMNRITIARVKAAKAAARNPNCDGVEWSEISPSRSRAPYDIVIFVDCRNGTRYYFPESDLR